MMATVIPDHGTVCKRRMEAVGADMPPQLLYPIPAPFQRQRLVGSGRSTNQLQFVLGAVGLVWRIHRIFVDDGRWQQQCDFGSWTYPDRVFLYRRESLSGPLERRMVNQF